MSKNLLVSICIPTFNQTFFLTKTLDSIVEQTYKDFEVIVSDDSTNYEVEKLLESYKNRLWINYTKNSKPLGSPANWNNLVKNAKGDLIKFMHHDDWFENCNSLANFVKVFQNHENCNFAFCSSKILNVEKDIFTFNQPNNQFLIELEKNPKILFNNNLIGSPSAIIYRKNNDYFDEKLKYLVDVDFYMRLLQRNNSFIYLQEALIVNTSNHVNQVTASSLNKKTQLGEYCYLYNKIYNGSLTGLKWSTFFIDLFRKYNVVKIEDLNDIGCEVPRPNLYFRLLIFLSTKL